jgi:hypothetical protein
LTDIALAIPHTPWVPERVASMHRLRNQLLYRPRFYREFTDREPNWQWADKMWTWAESTGADHFLQLQDDVLVGPQFWPHLREMIDAVPDQLIGLESVHEWSEVAYRLGHHWYKSSDCLIGVGYVIPRPLMIAFNKWRATTLRPGGAQGGLNEDTMIAVFCMTNGLRIWHPVPTIIDHDIEMASTYGNDAHSHRRPLVTTVRGAEVKGWEDVTNVRDMGRFYQSTPSACRKWVRGYGMDRYEAAMADRGDK